MHLSRAILAAALTVPVIASVFPEELTALRAFGLVFAVLLIAFAIWRRRSMSNGAVLLAIFGGIALAIVSGTELLDALLSAFAFERGNGGRILGLAVFAIVILFLLVLRALTESARMNQQLSALLEGLAWEEFREAKLPQRFRDKVEPALPGPEPVMVTVSASELSLTVSPPSSCSTHVSGAGLGCSARHFARRSSALARRIC